MLFAFLLIVALPDLVPVRWPTHDIKTLDLLRDTPFNCLLLEQADWSPEFGAEAARRGVRTLAVIRDFDAPAAVRKAVSSKAGGLVLEGVFPADVIDAVRAQAAAARMEFVQITTRSRLQLDSADAVIGTDQGVWPGVRAPDESSAKAAPSGGPWIDTNTGFLRYLRTAAKPAIWLANSPPAGQTFAVTRYLQAIGDAAMTGARWVVSLDAPMMAKLFAGDKNAIAGWKRIARGIHYYEEHKDWRAAVPFGKLALVEDTETGALLSGGILDMIAVKHTPVRPVPRTMLDPELIAGVQLTVNVDPSALNDAQRDVLRQFTRSGGTLLTGPPGWKFPMPRAGQITLEKEELGKLDEIWHELNALTGRRNLGARLFNVSTMLSNLLESRDKKQVILQLNNYSDYPVENVTVHVLGEFKAATLFRPDHPPVDLVLYPVDEGSGADLDQVDSAATVVFSR